jgi:hypothetical protein
MSISDEQKVKVTEILSVFLDDEVNRYFSTIMGKTHPSFNDILSDIKKTQRIKIQYELINRKQSTIVLYAPKACIEELTDLLDLYLNNKVLSYCASKQPPSTIVSKGTITHNEIKLTLNKEFINVI